MVISKSYFCDWEGCGKSYGKPAKLAEHIRSHTGDRPFICDHPECQKTFMRLSHLKRHQNLTHLSADLKKSFSCPQCPKCFSLSHHLKRHLKIHSEPKSSLNCKLCPEVFEKKALLKKHIRKAHSTKSYICSCGVSFPNWSQLVSHRKSPKCAVSAAAFASNPRKYNCVECLKSFNCRSKLRNHEKRVHDRTIGGGCKTFSCHLCNHFYTTNYALLMHLKTEHGGMRIKCPFCAKFFRHRHSLVKHCDRNHPGADEDLLRLVSFEPIESFSTHNLTESDASVIPNNNTLVYLEHSNMEGVISAHSPDAHCTLKSSRADLFSFEIKSVFKNASGEHLDNQDALNDNSSNILMPMCSEKPNIINQSPIQRLLGIQTV